MIKDNKVPYTSLIKCILDKNNLVLLVVSIISYNPLLTTDDNLDFLCESVRWCGDGTFKAAPKLWTQLYTIHEQKNGYTVPCVFSLLPNKRKESYNLVFSKIKAWIDVVSQNWQFESYLSDFEKGAFLAAVEVFPGIASEGCFFH